MGRECYVYIKKTKKKISNKLKLRRIKINIQKAVSDFKDFQKKCLNKIDYLKNQHPNIVAFGAAQMMPVLAYHSKSDFSFVKNLFDDNPNRIGRYLPHIQPKSEKTNRKKSEESFVIITANEMYRPIIKRLSKINPLRIITWYSDF